VVFAASEFKRAGSVIRTVIEAFNHVEDRTMSETIAGIKIPDGKVAKGLTQLIRDKEPDLLITIPDGCTCSAP
jgi:tRNA isopentenyl-2-thiomethyl-A-37 hydroxylase MiaE